MLRTLVVVCLSAVAVALSLGVVAYSLRQSAATDRKICVAVNNINAVITAQLLRAQQSLPRIQYYREHPAELRSQLADVELELLAFKPRRC